MRKSSRTSYAIRKISTAINKIKDYRKSLVTLVNEDEDVIKKIKEKISKSFGLGASGMERLQLQKYPKGGYYKEHFDAKSEDHYQKDKSFSQRKYSIIIYLNDNFIGGETVFPKKNMVKSNLLISNWQTAFHLKTILKIIGDLKVIIILKKFQEI